MGWMTCWRCKEKFGLADETEAMLRRSGRAFCCPWGHEAVFSLGPSEQDKLRQERDRLKQDAARLQDRITEEREGREAAERRASAARGQVTKIKKRVSHGVCPCCNRQFANLHNHMAQKHPGFMAEPTAGDVTVQ